MVNGSKSIGVVDYGSGNLRSVGKALEAVGASVTLVTKHPQLDGLDAVVVPGVGAFADCAQNLRQSGLWDPLTEWLRAGRPYLGICLGYQLLFESSEESPGSKGLG
ncbi:MAG TPA: imidazole glycerol phosphate synthase subunit HisH, partial [Terrimicrobiaceae bacterium]